MNFPPEQDSPNNIVNALNGDCVQAIFGELTSLHDFKNASDVCTWFQQNAIDCFRHRYKMVVVNDNLRSLNSIHETDMRGLLDTFGPLIESIKWLYCMNRIQGNATIKMIQQHCGQTLRELLIQNQDVDFSIEFKELRKLELNFGTICNLKLGSQLTTLILRKVKVYNVDWLVKPLPVLEEIEFCYLNEMKSKNLLQFLRLNPQIKKLKLYCCNRIISTTLPKLATCAPNLTELTFASFHSKEVRYQFEANIMHLAHLQKLKSLSIFGRNFSAKILVERLVKRDIPIENLTIDGGDADLSVCIPKLKLLKSLVLILPHYSEENLIETIRYLPQLKKLIITIREITPWGILKTMELCKKLSVFTIYTIDMLIDHESHKSLIDMAEGRVKVLLAMVTEGMVHIENTSTNNSKWFDIQRQSSFGYSLN